MVEKVDCNVGVVPFPSTVENYPFKVLNFTFLQVALLKKQGVWSLKRLPKVKEPTRIKTQWDYLLEEMQWLATDFHQEKKWKKAAAKKLAMAVAKVEV